MHSLKNTLLLKYSNHHLSHQQVLIILPVEWLKYFENYQNVTET